MKFNFKKVLQNRSLSPRRDWRIVFFIFLLINLGFFFYLGSLYLTLSHAKEIPESDLVEVKFIDEKLLGEVLGTYRAKQEKLGSIDVQP